MAKKKPRNTLKGKPPHVPTIDFREEAGKRRAKAKEPVALSKGQKGELKKYFGGSPEPLLEIEASTRGYLKRHYHWDLLPTSAEYRDACTQLIKEVDNLLHTFFSLDPRIRKRLTKHFEAVWSNPDEFFEVLPPPKKPLVEEAFQNDPANLWGALRIAHAAINTSLKNYPHTSIDGDVWFSKEGKGKRKRGTRTRARDEFLIPSLVRIFTTHAKETIQDVDLSEGYRVDSSPNHEYLDVLCGFIETILSWYSIPSPSNPDTSKKGEASQGPLRRMVKQILLSLIPPA